MADITLLIPQSAQEQISKALELFGSLREIKITSQENYDHCGELLVQIKQMINLLEDDRKSIIKEPDGIVRSVNAHYKSVRDKLENGERVMKAARQQFFAELERKRIEQQRKLEAEAAEERRKAEAKAEEERRKAEAYREQGKETLAAKAEARAESAEVKAATTVAPIVQEVSAGKNSSMRKYLRVEIVNEQAAKLYCLNNPALCGYVTLDIKGIEKLINASKGVIKVEGVNVTEEYREAVRAA